MNFEYSEPNLNIDRYVRSQALSQHSEIQLDKVVNRLFEDAGKKKIKRE